MEIDAKKRKMLYVVVIIICIASIIIGIVTEIATTNPATKKGEEKKPVSSGNGGSNIPSTETIEGLQKEFEYMFKNNVDISGIDDSGVAKLYPDEEIVFTAYKNNKIEKDKYNIDINIPMINIGSGVAGEFNGITQKYFADKTQEVIENSREFTIYNVYYTGYVNDNILSLVIKSTLKVGNSPQKTFITAYNYNLETGLKYDINEAVKSRGIKMEEAQEKINLMMKGVERDTNSLKEALKDNESQSKTIYERKFDDKMYKIENTETYFLGPKGFLYIIYSYGNKDGENTSAVDIVKI